MSREFSPIDLPPFFGQVFMLIIRKIMAQMYNISI